MASFAPSGGQMGVSALILHTATSAGIGFTACLMHSMIERDRVRWRHDAHTRD
ncbi:hypothetical protein SRABI76_01498 [Microbacterium oxydans]|nr:hypothetical protein SRABI76_01498 [Microbacterium oxydans]